MNNPMNAKNTVAGSLSQCYITIDGKRKEFGQAINLEASLEKKKTELAILGKTGKSNRSTGWKGTGKAKFYYNTSVFREALKRFKETGEDIYFDIQVTNEDSTSSVGRQTVMLLDCNTNGGILTKFDAEADVLTEDIDFTFDDFDIPEQFDRINGLM